MITAKTEFSSEDGIRAYIADCEASYKAYVEQACTRALPFGMITLCGPSCSGKTTTAKRLSEAFAAHGKRLHVVSIDDFYYDHDRLVDLSGGDFGKIDYDSPKTIDIPRFAKAVADIEDFGTVTLPRYDLAAGRRVEEVTFPVTEEDVFLFEGIQAVYPALIEHLSKHRYLPLFISVENRLRVGEVTFSRNEVRFLRRLVRDDKFRGASPEFTFAIWKSVSENEKKNILPNVPAQAFRMDSLLPYEVSVIKPFAMRLLGTIGTDSPYALQAALLRERLSAVPVIDAKYVPANSVFREFIGE